MTCPGCAQANSDTARFCNGCGAPLAPRCQTCGADNPPGARFCNGCGSSLATRPAVAETRKVVTIVFADLIGSTSLHERLDPESVSRLMDRYYQVVREPVEAHGGSVVQLLGDGVMCAFGIPRAGENDSLEC